MRTCVLAGNWSEEQALLEAFGHSCRQYWRETPALISLSFGGQACSGAFDGRLSGTHDYRPFEAKVTTTDESDFAEIRVPGIEEATQVV